MIRFPRVFLPALGLLLAAWATAVGVRAWLGERALAEGGRLQRQGQFALAAGAYRRGAALGSADAAIAGAQLALGREDWAGADACLRDALAISPARGYAHLLRARLEAARPGPWDGAREDRVLGACRTAVALDPAGAGLWHGCAAVSLRLAHARRGGWDPARERTVLAGAAQDAAEAVSREPAEVPRTLSALAEAGADAPFLVDAAWSGGGAAALAAAVKLLMERGLWPAAEAAYWARGAAVGALPAFAVAAADEHLRRRLPREALAALDRGRRAAPADAALAARAADAAARLPGVEALEAVPLYREALSLAPSDVALRRRFAGFLAARGQLPEAEAEARRVVAADAGGADGWTLLADVLRRAGRAAEAADAAARAAAIRDAAGR